MVTQQGTGTVFWWEETAISGGEMPDGLPHEEQTIFVRLRYLYDLLRKEQISQAAATREKMKYLDAYRIEKAGYECLKRYSEIIKKTEIATSEYRKNRTLENADKLVTVLEGVV